MTYARISHTFYLALLEFLMAAKQQIVAIGSEFGLSSIQTATLLLLDDTRPRPMKSLCTLYHCDASNITGIIDGLEKRGLVSRQNDARDRRIKVIQLETTGKQLQQTIIERLAASNSFLFDPLSQAEAQQFVHIVEKIAAVTTPKDCDRSV
ncbi:MAG TPA: MarR family winged helix-turn-helix transcriptional regulator [Verrucomicrobiae bacterium]|nr:MarR family winged helix-turn-helix transcriptional regulator [Verrucomicrobiae bacterium]